MTIVGGLPKVKRLAFKAFSTLNKRSLCGLHRQRNAALVALALPPVSRTHRMTWQGEAVDEAENRNGF